PRPARNARTAETACFNPGKARSVTTETTKMATGALLIASSRVIRRIRYPARSRRFLRGYMIRVGEPNASPPGSPRIEASGPVRRRRVAAQVDRLVRFEAGEYVRIVRGGSEKAAAVVEAPDHETPHRHPLAIVEHGEGLDASRSRRLARERRRGGGVEQGLPRGRVVPDERTVLPCGAAAAESS